MPSAETRRKKKKKRERREKRSWERKRMDPRIRDGFPVHIKGSLLLLVLPATLYFIRERERGKLSFFCRDLIIESFLFLLLPLSPSSPFPPFRLQYSIYVCVCGFGVGGGGGPSLFPFCPVWKKRRGSQAFPIASRGFTEEGASLSLSLSLSLRYTASESLSV